MKIQINRSDSNEMNQIKFEIDDELMLKKSPETFYIVVGHA